MATRWTNTMGVALVTIVVAGVFATTGCGPANKKDPPSTTSDDADDATLAADAADANLAESDPELLTSSLISSSPTGNLGLASADLGGGDIGTDTFGDAVNAVYTPHGCLSVADDTATSTATYAFGVGTTLFTSHCRGPNGLTLIAGTVTAKHEVTSTGLHLDLTTAPTALQVNRATVDWHATADISSNNSNRTMTWSAQLSGTTGTGKTFSRTASHTITWMLGEECFSLEGTSEGKIRDRDVKTEVKNFRRCRGSCPEAGGEIIITNVAKDKQIELLYDGTGTATFVNSKGVHIPVTLPCASL